jgi:branched-chain amino acid aminotransferase
LTERYYHVDGEVVPASEATVSVADRGFRLGDAAVERMRAYGGEVFRWSAHADRLGGACADLGMAGAVPEDLPLRVAETLEANGLADAAVRVHVTRGDGPGLTPPAEPDPTVVVAVEGLPRGGRDGERTWSEPAVVGTVSRRRIPEAAVPGAERTHGALDRVLARRELSRAANERYRPDEALLRETDGTVAGGAASELFWVNDGVLRTSAARGRAPLAVRGLLLELAEGESFPVETGPFGLEEVRGADEAFLANHRWELRPVASVDGLAAGDGPITRLLGRLYDEEVQRRCY